MIYRYFLKQYIKMILIQDKKAMKEMKKFLKNKFKKYYYLIIFDPRIIILRIISKNKKLQEFVIVKMLKKDLFLKMYRTNYGN